ncbi:MAG: PEP-CTERM sorting domain-containing protein [Gemmatimonadaceae bacterium]|nr:PEP-CTERM sorting domain-containing protein [Gemmatimonadaceae bacterium]
MTLTTRCARAIGTTMVLFSPLVVQAQDFNPTGTWGNVPAGVTFGGSGIPGPVMTTEVGSIGPRLTLGASQRYDNPALTKNGAGTYFYTPGADACTAPLPAVCPAPGYAKWNFNYAVTGDDIASYEYRLFYSLTPIGTPDHLWLDFQPGFVFPSFTVPLQNSLNLGMAALDQVPGAPNFDPSTAGTYRFALVAYDVGTDIERGRVAIALSTTTVPEPTTVSMLALGAIAMLAVAHRRRRSGTIAA